MPTNKCPFCDWLRDIPAKEAHRVVAEMKASWLVLSASQAYRGYCMLIAKTHADEIFRLSEKDRRDFSDDLARAAEAIYNAFKPDKLNYEILGNQTPHLHYHIIPRRNTDPVDARYPIWGQRFDEPRMAHHDYRALAEQIAAELNKLAAPSKRRAVKKSVAAKKPSGKQAKKRPRTTKAG